MTVMTIAIIIGVLIIWYVCGRFNHQCMYGWSKNLWSTLPTYWEGGGRDEAVEKWRFVAYALGPIGLLFILVNGDIKYRCKVRS